MNAEQIIKQALDGHFWSLSPDGDRVRHVIVPQNYIPDHKPAWDIDQCALGGKKAGEARRRPWLTAEDDRLLELRAQGLRWQTIGGELQRGDKSTRQRYYELCEERGITPVEGLVSKPKPLTPELKARIVELREKGWGFREINAELGLIGFKARDYYSRYKRSQLETRRAA